MVSGFVTSPCDQLRIFSGEARLIRIASKSATGFARSNGLERNKVSSTSRDISLPPAAPDYLVNHHSGAPSFSRSLREGGDFDRNVAENAGAWRYQLFSSNCLICFHQYAACLRTGVSVCAR